MSILLNTSLISSVQMQLSSLELQIDEESQKMLDLHSYATSIADGTISMDDLMTTPGSMFNRTTMFMQNSNMSAYMGAQQKMAYMSRIPGAVPQIADPRAQQMYYQAMFKNFYDQNRQQIVQQEKKNLSMEETKIQQKIDSLTARKKMLEKRLENAQKDQDKGIERFFAKA